MKVLIQSCLFLIALWGCSEGLSAINNTILDVAKSLGAVDFLKYCDDTGLNALLSTKGPFTVFIPTNKAFMNLPDNINSSMSDREFVDELLKYHVVNGTHMSSDFRNEMLIKSHNHKSVRINIYMEPHKTVMTASGSVISLADLQASNGIVHMLDRVMYIWPSLGNLDRTIAFVPYLQYVLYGFYHANMSKEITKGGPFTVLAPVDPAWQKLPSSFIDNLRNNHTALREVMRNHVIAGTYFTEPMYENQTLTTLSGNQLIVHISEKNTTVNNALIILQDFIAANGVVQLTSDVFLPPSIHIEGV